MAWVSIGIAVFGAIFSVVWWLFLRRMSRIDALEAAVFGTDGLNLRLHKYVTQGTLEAEMGKLRQDLRGVSDEGQAREDRILKAIHNLNLVVGSEVREIKHDIRAQNERIDAVMMARRDSR